MEWEKQSPICSSVNLFTFELRKVFDLNNPGREAVRGLLNLCQGGRCIVDYSTEFRTVAAESKWNQHALYSHSGVHTSEFPDPSNVPPEYLDMMEVINKPEAIFLLAHRPYDCTIDLLPGTFLPKGPLRS